MAVLRDTAQAAGISLFAAIQTVAPSLGVEVNPINVRDAGEIERAVAAFARASNGGLIVTASGPAVTHRDLIITLAARHKLPAVYSERHFIAAGGLVSYGADIIDQYRRAAGYVDRILKGEKPADLPVQAPTKYRACHQPQDRQVARSRRAADAARPRRRGDRVMKRREFITLVGGAAMGWPIAGFAQEAGKIRRIGFLRVGAPPAAFIDGFRRGLREVGLVEGRDYVIEFALAQNTAQVPAAVAELVRRRVDILLASGTPSVLPARDAAGQIPVVFVATFDPVATELVASLARPGGNITGMTSISGDVIAKRLQLVTELIPNAARIAILVRETSPTAAQYVRESEAAARSMGIALQIENARDVNDLDAMFLAVNGVSVLLVADDAEFTARRAELARLGLKHRLPTVSGLKEMVEAGGLMAYGGSFAELYRRAASHVHKILQGTSPAELPVEQAIKFELVLNLKTAKALGIEVPPSLLARADEVIE